LCVDDGGFARQKIRPIGAVIIVILYWLVATPGPVAWREQLEVALHATVTAMTVQIILQLTFAVRRYVTASGRWVAGAVRRVYRWIADRVDVRFGGVQVQLGVR
jgi:hypothetical protein